MTKFEAIGVSRQDASASKEEAIEQFQNSCHICCNRGLRIDCARCAIKSSHELNLTAFEVLNSGKEVV